jgi:hypothetical protein
MAATMSFRCWCALVALVWAGRVSAEVTRVEIAERVDLGASGYERITGTLHFAVDPAHPRNAIIADLDRAPVSPAGRVEFSADLQIFRPKEARRGNGAALVEISNRGGKNSFLSFQRGGTRDPRKDADLGDAFLFRHGFTLVTVGWEFDVPERAGAMRIRVPVATDAGRAITGQVRAAFTVNSRVAQFTVTDLAVYPPVDPDAADRRLEVRDAASAPRGTEIPPARWKLAGTTVTLEGGFDPGRTYVVSYRAAHPPVAGLGLAAIRDATAWLKHAPDSPAPVRHAYSFGSSQSGRFLRDFVYQGFNTDERGRMVFDGVLAHIAGGARLDLNRRWAVTREQAMFNAASYPFADTAQKDPVTGISEGILENPRVTHAPRIFYTNTSAEYWGGGRVGALVHTDPAGAVDVALPDRVRLYFFAGTQHGPAGFPPPSPEAGALYGNPTNFWPAMRALLLAMHRWVTEGVAPPPSVHPTFRDGTLVRAAAVQFPRLAGMPSPQPLKAGVRVRNPLWPDGAGMGAELPLLVSQVDADGNELAGIRLPEIAVPLGTHTGWTFRPPATGVPTDLVPLRGAWIPFALTSEARLAANDPRLAVAERYSSRADFLARSRVVAEGLVRGGYLLPEDVGWVVEQAAARWDWLSGRGP